MRLQHNRLGARLLAGLLLGVALAGLDDANVALASESLVAHELGVHLCVCCKKKKWMNRCGRRIQECTDIAEWMWIRTPNVDSWTLRIGFLMPLRWALRSAKRKRSIQINLRTKSLSGSGNQNRINYLLWLWLVWFFDLAIVVVGYDHLRIKSE